MGDSDQPDSTWSLADSESDTAYYHHILTDLSWTELEQNPLHSPRDSRLAYVDEYQQSVAPASAPAQINSPVPDVSSRSSDPAPATSNPSMTSSSSEDPTEKSGCTTTVAPPTAAEPDTSNKVKQKGQKRVRQQRFAFMTKSEVDHLEDGYRWRKYGQKAVKNSPFPRSYYRCTNTKCTVKKRVERSSEDPTVVITTYEGQHCHHTVGFPRSTGFINHDGAFLGQFGPSSTSHFFYPGLIQFPHENSLITNDNISQSGSVNTSHSSHHQQQRRRQRQLHDPSPADEVIKGLLPSAPRSLSSHRLPPQPSGEGQGQGLLGDIVPPLMRNPFDVL